METPQSIFEQPKAPPVKKEDKHLGIDLVQISNELNSVSRRVRIMEERYINLRRKTQVTDQNMLLNNKRLSNEIRIISDDIKELGRDLSELNTKVKLVVKELKECAKNEEVTVLQKYIEMWQPINFVTRHEVERIVEDCLENKSYKKEGI